MTPYESMYKLLSKYSTVQTSLGLYIYYCITLGIFSRAPVCESMYKLLSKYGTVQTSLGLYIYYCNTLGIFSRAPVCVRAYVRACVRGILPINTWPILMTLRLKIPVHHAQCVWQKIEHRSKVKVTKKHETHCLSHSWLVSKCSWSKYLSEVSCPHDVLDVK